MEKSDLGVVDPLHPTHYDTAAQVPIMLETGTDGARAKARELPQHAKLPSLMCFIVYEKPQQQATNIRSSLVRNMLRFAKVERNKVLGR